MKIKIFLEKVYIPLTLLRGYPFHGKGLSIKKLAVSGEGGCPVRHYANNRSLW